MKNIGKQSILRTCECTYTGKQTILRTCESICWTSMPIMSHYNYYYWTSMPILSQSEKLLYVLSHPAGLLSRKNDDFWNFGTYPFSKSVYFLILSNFYKNSSPGQTTINHYAHETRSEILCRTPVSILLYLSPRPQNLRKTSNNSFLA